LPRAIMLSFSRERWAPALAERSRLNGMSVPMSHDVPSGEFAFIDWLRRRTPAAARVLIGPGDDTAALSWPNGVPCLVTTDMLLEGSCFRLDEAGPRRIGRKAMAVNLSDIAA